MLNKIWVLLALIIVGVTADVRQLPSKEYLPPAQTKIISYDELSTSDNEIFENKSGAAKDPVPFPGPGFPIPPGYGLAGAVPNFAGGNGFPAYPTYFPPGFGGPIPPPPPPPYQQSYPGAPGYFPGPNPGHFPGPGPIPTGPVFPDFGGFPNAGNFPIGPELAPFPANGGGGFPLNPTIPTQGYLATTVPGQGFPPGIPGPGVPAGPGFPGGPLGFPGPGIPPPPGPFPGQFDTSNQINNAPQLKNNIAHDTVYGSDGGYVYEKPK